MNSQQLLHADVLDILFEHRNKSYGAYQLRRTYNQRLLLSLAISFAAVFLLLLLLPSKGKQNVLPSYKNDEVHVRIIETVPPPVETPPPPPQQAAPAPAVAQIQYNNIAIAPDVQVTDEVPPQELITGSAISDVTKAGNPDIGFGPPVSNGNGEGAVTPEKIEEEATVGITAAPHFPGGTAAWLRFLSRNLRAPAGMEAGEKKSVLVRFLVGADGSITQFEVLQSGGAAFDREVIRVLKNGPKWAPALQNGRPVSTTFTQPVTFVSSEE